MRYATVLFDLDGTLTDSGLGIGRSVSFALASLGAPALSVEQLRAFVGPPLPESFAALGFDEQRCALAITKYREYFATTGLYENAVYAGIEPLLAALQGRGVTMAVATSKPQVFARKITDHFGLSGYFAHVAGSELDGSLRHKHEVIARALAALGLEPGADICMVGDRAHDAAGAARLGLDFVGVAWGYSAPGELTDAGAGTIVATPADLLDILTEA